MSISEEIELYSGNRNRLLYPLQSSFDVPLSSTNKNIEDPIINGTIYFKFTIEPSQNPQINIFTGQLTSYSDNSSFYITPSLTSSYPTLDNFFTGYIIILGGSTDERIIKSYTPSTGLLTLDEPWSDTFINPSGANFTIFQQNPTYNYISIPTIDINGNIALNYDGAYNSYYIVFESDYPEYSNQYNSNIFSRQISYYDNVNRLAYFDTPISFNYKDSNGFYPANIYPQYITIRKSIPFERWSLSTNTYFNKNSPLDPIIGPLIGPVITLPEGASGIDNYYKGKYVYYYSNVAYNPIPSINNTSINLSDNQLYAIYGFYYIKAYNASTRELSIYTDVNNTSCKRNLDIGFPAMNNITSVYNASSFVPALNVSSISETSPGSGIYRADITVGPGPFGGQFELCVDSPIVWTKGRNYKVTWRLRRNPLVDQMLLNTIFGVFNLYSYNVSTYFYYIDSNYITLSFTLLLTSNFLGFAFYLSYVDPTITPYLEWDFFEIVEDTIINITDLSKDNYSPLDYIGTMVGMNEAVCYDVSLCSLTLPNTFLKTGSRISFYPYVYVELANITSSNLASNQIIYSNNPNSNRAIFIAPVNIIVNPISRTFLTLYSNMIQTIKFKPNDNLRFSVYLPDGKLFETFIVDTLPPYEPETNIQIEAVFKIKRKTNTNTML